MKTLTLKEIREKKHMTLLETTLDPALIYKIEQGERNLTLKSARTLAKVYKMSLDKIVAADDLVR